MKKTWKRNAVVASVLLLVCAAIYLNGRYAERAEESNRTLGQAVQVDAPESETEVSLIEEPDVSAEAAEEEITASDYFAAARLTRQQARDSALSLLQEASEGEGVDPEVASGAAQSIQTLASYTLTEAQIENMITAKGYEDCVVFMADNSVSVVVSTQDDGLQTEDIARITDIVKQETGLSASAIRILEVS